MAERTVTTRLGVVQCPSWCRDDHSDIDEASSALWHASAPIGGLALMHPSYVDGLVAVQLRQFVVLDGTEVSVDPVTVNFGVDDDFNEGGGHFAPDQARAFAAALCEAAGMVDGRG